MLTNMRGVEVFRYLKVLMQLGRELGRELEMQAYKIIFSALKVDG